MADPREFLSGLLDLIPGLGTLQGLPIVGDLVGGVLGKALSGIAGFFGSKPAAPELPPGYSYSDYPTWRNVPVWKGTHAGPGSRGGSGPGTLFGGISYAQGGTGGLSQATLVKQVYREGAVVMHEETGIPVGVWDNDDLKLIEVEGFTKEGVMILQGWPGSELIGTSDLSKAPSGQRPPPDMWKPIGDEWGEEILDQQKARAENVAGQIYPVPWILIGSGAVLLFLVIFFLVRKGKK